MSVKPSATVVTRVGVRMAPTVLPGVLPGSSYGVARRCSWYVTSNLLLVRSDSKSFQDPSVSVCLLEKCNGSETGGPCTRVCTQYVPPSKESGWEGVPFGWSELFDFLPLHPHVSSASAQSTERRIVRRETVRWTLTGIPFLDLFCTAVEARRDRPISDPRTKCDLNTLDPGGGQRNWRLLCKSLVKWDLRRRLTWDDFAGGR